MKKDKLTLIGILLIVIVCNCNVIAQNSATNQFEGTGFYWLARVSPEFGIKYENYSCNQPGVVVINGSASGPGCGSTTTLYEVSPAGFGLATQLGISFKVISGYEIMSFGAFVELHPVFSEDGGFTMLSPGIEFGLMKYVSFRMTYGGNIQKSNKLPATFDFDGSNYTPRTYEEISGTFDVAVSVNIPIKSFLDLNINYRWHFVLPDYERTAAGVGVTYYLKTKNNPN